MTLASADSDGIDLAVRFTGSQAILSVVGEVDIATAPEFAALLGAAMDRRLDVVVDLAGLDFMDASGIGVLVMGAERLRISDGSLICRAPKPMLARMFGILGLIDVLQVQIGGWAEDGPESRATGEPTGLPEARRNLSLAPRLDDVIDAALRVVVAVATATVRGADRASISLSRSGHLITVAASDTTALAMDRHQYVTGEGPGYAASIEGAPHHTAIETEDRWPAFVRKANELGVNAVLSSPLHSGERPIGALNLYSHANGSFSDDDQELAMFIANETSALLLYVGF